MSSPRPEGWTQLTSRLPPLDAVVEVDAAELAERLASLPDEGNALLRLVDGRRSLRRVMDDSGLDEMGAAAALVRLHEEGILRIAPAPGSPPAGETPAPDGVEWFADPAARRAALAAGTATETATETAMGTAVPPPDRARGQDPLRQSQAPAWVVGAVLALAAAIVAGPEWLRRQGVPPAGVPAAPTLAEPARPAPSPPALAVTEPPPAAIRLPPAVPEPLEEPPPSTAPPAALDRPPAYAEAMSAAEASHRSGDFSAAAASFRRAIGVQETSEAQAGLGRALSDALRPEEALAALRRATALDPANGPAWLTLGEVHLALGDAVQARAAYERYLAVDPSGRHAGEVRAALARLRP
jgi:tetratricopeptide (TPR) repeat protein